MHHQQHIYGILAATLHEDNDRQHLPHIHVRIVAWELT